MKTYQITAELEVAGEYDRDVEVIITSDREITSQTAVTLIRLLYPNRIVTAIEVEES